MQEKEPRATVSEVDKTILANLGGDRNKKQTVLDVFSQIKGLKDPYFPPFFTLDDLTNRLVLLAEKGLVRREVSWAITEEGKKLLEQPKDQKPKDLSANGTVAMRKSARLPDHMTTLASPAKRKIEHTPQAPKLEEEDPQTVHLREDHTSRPTIVELPRRQNTWRSSDDLEERSVLRTPDKGEVKKIEHPVQEVLMLMKRRGKGDLLLFREGDTEVEISGDPYSGTKLKIKTRGEVKTLTVGEFLADPRFGYRKLDQALQRVLYNLSRGR